MAKKDLEDPFGEPTDDLNLSDADLDALMAGSLAVSGDEYDAESLSRGDRVEGTVTGVGEGEILLEIGRKNHGVIALDEFGDEPPAVGDRLAADVVRYDTDREVTILSVKAARQELFWDSVEIGDVIEGVAVEQNRGGLSLDIRGERAFLPISQIDRVRVEDTTPYIGRTLQCEVISVDRAGRDLVVSRRRVLDREVEESRVQAAARFRVGDVIDGEVVRINEHGAFVSLGPLEGLLHASKIRNQRELGDSLHEGQRLEVEIVHLDLESGRVGLDCKRVSDDPAPSLGEDYAEGDRATGLVTRVTDEGAFIQIDERVEGLLPASVLRETDTTVEKGSLCAVEIRAIDRESGRVELALL